MEFLRSAFKAIRTIRPKELLAILRDGNLMETTLHTHGATLVGIDRFGNKYYEKLDAQFGRHRFVEYADIDNYDASTVPPEWHGWLHYITDYKSDELLPYGPKRYGIGPKPNAAEIETDTSKIETKRSTYYSKGHALNPNQRDWTRCQTWHSSE